jgi:phosphatidylglycerophosphate synthase
MHKLKTENEGPVDIVFLTLTEWVTPLFHATGHTPNMITTYSLLCGLGAAYALWEGWLVTFVVLFLVAYLFDCVDGYMARRYKQMSVFGDYYDHISDVVKTAALFYVIVCKYPIKKVAPIGIALGALLVGMLTYQGCAQKIIKEEGFANEGETLDMFQNLCASDDTIHWIKYFSCGTFQLAIVAAACYLELTRSSR